MTRCADGAFILRMKRPLLAVSVLALVAGLAACGTTVPLSRLQAQGGPLQAGTQSGLGGTQTQGGAATSQGAGSGGAGSTGTGGGTSGAYTSSGSDAVNAGGSGATAGSQAGGASAGSGQGGSGSGAPGKVATGVGVTATTVSIGIIYTDTSDANIGAQFGAKNLVYGDLRAEQQAVVSYINSHGGVAGGRKITLVAYDATSNSTVEALCAYWTEDNHVFAGVYPGGQVEDSTGVSCMAQHHTPLIETPFDPGSQSFMNQYSEYYYAPSALESVRMGTDYVNGLYNQGFFSGGHKIGLLYYDMPSLQAALQQGVEPALASHGLRLSQSDVYAITYPASDSQDGAAVAAVDNAELRMHTDGVDRVLMLDAGAGLAFFFMNQAQSQAYHPRYGLESGSNPAFVDQNETAAQLTGAMGVGWLPTGDVDQPYVPDSPARALCRQIMTAAGQPPQSESDLYAQYDMCSVFFMLRDALGRARSVTPSGLQAAVDSLGSDPNASAASFGDSYATGKQWGAGEYMDLQYQTTCSCFRYVGSPHQV